MAKKNSLEYRSLKTSDVSLGAAALKQLWLFGDWLEIINATQHGNVDSSSQVEKFYRLSALLQTGDDITLVRHLKLTPEEKIEVARLLVSGVYNSLAKAAACNLDDKKTRQFVEAAIKIVEHVDAVSRPIINARYAEQMAQLGLPSVNKPNCHANFTIDTSLLLTALSLQFPQEPALHIASAEYAQEKQRFDDAIRHWQQVGAILGAEMPQQYYDRLKLAYQSSGSFPLGTPEQEHLSGQGDKHQLLAQIHKRVQPSFYLEIGVQTGKSLALAECEAIGIDPMPMLKFELGKNSKVITSTSDTFFARQADILLLKSVDLVFIDGMHLFEYALRDFMNVEKYSNKHTLVVIDDIYPGHPSQANRNRCTRAWTGDVWKLIEVFKEYRPDLAIRALNVYPTGLLIISGLDADNSVLANSYEKIVSKYIPITTIPEHIISRGDSESFDSFEFENFLDRNID